MTTLRILLRSFIASGAVACAVFLAGPASAFGSTSGTSTPELTSALDQQPVVSANWAGYVASGESSTASEEKFSSVSGSWVQPSVNCSVSETESAFWVGLGGEDSQSEALEQAGTEADCSSSGQATYYAWYELLPAAPVHLGLAVHAGDHISTTVSVSGSTVQIELKDTTTGASEAKTLQMTDPDVSSAEWIAEAPSACVNIDDCQPLSLADFGSVEFTGATATASGHAGPISDWSAEPIELSSSAESSGYGYDGYGSAGYSGYGDLDTGQSSANAVPSSLASSGSSFSVTWESSADAEQTESGSSGSGYGEYEGYGGTGGYEGYGSYGETGTYEGYGGTTGGYEGYGSYGGTGTYEGYGGTTGGYEGYGSYGGTGGYGTGGYEAYGDTGGYGSTGGYGIYTY